MQTSVDRVSTWLEQTVARGNAFLRRFSILALLLDTWEAFEQDHLSLFAAALAFYTLLALFPLLLLLIALGPVFGVEQSVMPGVMGVVRAYLPGAQGQVQEVLGQVLAARGPATLVGILTLLWSATGVFDTLQTAMDRAWRVPRDRSFWLQRLFSIGAVGVLGTLFLTGLLVSLTAVSVVGSFLGDSNAVRQVMQWVSRGLSIMLAFALFALLFKTFPRAQVSWGQAQWGAVLAVVLGSAARIVFEFYLGNLARFNLVYGSVGAVIALLLWCEISATVILLGAELSATLGRRNSIVRRGVSKP